MLSSLRPVLRPYLEGYQNVIRAAVTRMRSLMLGSRRSMTGRVSRLGRVISLISCIRFSMAASVSSSTTHHHTAQQLQQPLMQNLTPFKAVEELRQNYEPKGVTPDKDVICYCRIGERSSHSWFVLKYLLGYPKVRNYDGSWTEWGNMIGNPVEK